MKKILTLSLITILTYNLAQADEDKLISKPHTHNKVHELQYAEHNNHHHFKHDYFLYLGADYNLNKAKNYQYTKSEVSSSTEKWNNGMGFTLGFGKQVNDNFSTQINFHYKPETLIYSNFTFKTPADTYNSIADLKSYGMMAQVNYLFNNSSIISPYISGQVGLMYNNLSNIAGSISSANDDTTNSYGDNKTSFAWGIGLGALVKLNDKVNLDFGFKYTKPGKASISKYSYENGTAGVHIDNTLAHNAYSLRTCQFLVGVKVSL